MNIIVQRKYIVAAKANVSKVVFHRASSGATILDKIIFRIANFVIELNCLTRW